MTELWDSTGEGASEKMMPAQYRVDANKNFVEKLKEIYGEDFSKASSVKMEIRIC